MTKIDEYLLKGINLYLIGMAGSGKTTVGRLLAQQMGYGFLDTDEVIVKATGKTISQLFAEVGEGAFRQLESDVLAQVCSYTKLSVATGGGIILRRENWSYLHHGLIVWLDVPVEILLKRLEEDTTRPLLQDTDRNLKMRSLLEQRQSLYAQADLQITVTEDQTPEQIAKRVLEAIPGVLKEEYRSQNSEFRSNGMGI
ncbi:shikimate kinase [Aetokthonos hydrillicola Thurmond2011]|jgi:shikimate kinase|uniref:Shikimate kinase n=1 Tax=Aetokthonos hydrillicola Thurmond2011 TaxID=2712845 RepID=A0AAP5IBJ2_9CYAN|nr:shikimate kinase [Aetokthonos hydrillicola]MBO3464383.1 shikimate kinase [Aetokthonos hydrillicola CCALA 1050]MBW4584239.1 shikimate kinase [Aetokthonos hydrillicola CCALA 1050]MDR9898552.1 shikimate kinase [Aetokthonos hydrillicola Thurmond2011]